MSSLFSEAKIQRQVLAKAIAHVEVTARLLRLSFARPQRPSSARQTRVPLSVAPEERVPRPLVKAPYASHKLETRPESASGQKDTLPSPIHTS
jgi:hypothetical protein